MKIKNFSPELLEAVKNKNKYFAERMLEAEALAEEVKKKQSSMLFVSIILMKIITSILKLLSPSLIIK